MEMNKRLLITLATGVFLLVTTIITIKLAKGYRPDLKNGRLKATGLLLANSIPRGAQVFVNGKLTTATDDTFNLSPGEYQVKIAKDGYHPWEKKLKIEAELVAETNARLFPAVPELKPLTFTGAFKPLFSPNGNKVAFTIATASAELKTGIWILDLATGPLSFPPKPRQIARSTPFLDFSQSNYSFSPDGSKLLVNFANASYLLDSDRLNTQLTNIKAKVAKIEEEWEEDKRLRQKTWLARFPKELQQIMTESAKIIALSPDETKILYLAEKNVKIPKDLIPKVPAASTQPEERDLKANVLYVYDRREDRNFRTHEAIENIAWFPDSRHLAFTDDKKIKIVEYDDQNETVIYAGDFEENFVAVWPDGSRLVILTNLNPDSPLPPNLYAINLK